MLFSKLLALVTLVGKAFSIPVSGGNSVDVVGPETVKTSQVNPTEIEIDCKEHDIELTCDFDCYAILCKDRPEIL
jgi:hypothetical protein